MKTENLRELDAWIEINVFGKKVFSEIRGEYEWFYFLDEKYLSRKEAEKLKPRDWSEYDPKKHILPDAQPNPFTRESAYAMTLLKKCAEKCDQNNRYIKINRTKGMLGDNTKGSTEIWDVMEWDEIDMFASSGGQPTLELGIVHIARQLFQKEGV